MRTPILKTLTVLVLLASCAVALAETPTRVGRISLTQGQVTIGGEQGEESANALVNWPVTSRNQLTTGPGARTEIRIGSTSIRLDADSALDVAELDDDTLRLHLHYGSASVRVRNPDQARGFELSTPQGMIRLQEATRMRVDAGRRSDTTSVNIFEGMAIVEGGGSRLSVRPGRRLEFGMDDVRTGIAVRDSFDDWALLRDQRDERSMSARYVTSEMTGYEELDQYGSWEESTEYGPLWSPRVVPSGWVPYRDGRWTYVQPWGWTWVDHSPWGYAPSHYGRWVMIGRRWAWAPGRDITRPIWAPALVGWVGGSGWNLSFNTGGYGRAPAQGWYPLSPRERYVPSYRLAEHQLRYLNRHAWTDGGRGDQRRHNRNGLTVVPHDHFNRRGPVLVTNAPRANVADVHLVNAPSVIPSAPAGTVNRLLNRIDRDRDGRVDARFDRNGDGRVDANAVRRGDADRNNDGRVDARFDRNGDGRVDAAIDRNNDGRPDSRGERNGSDRFERGNSDRDGNGVPDGRDRNGPARVITLPSQPVQPQPGYGRQRPEPVVQQPAVAAPAPVVIQQPVPQPQPQGRGQRDDRFNRGDDQQQPRGPREERFNRGESQDGMRDQRQRFQAPPQVQQPAPQPVQQAAPPVPRPAPQPAYVAPPPPPQAAQPPAPRQEVAPREKEPRRNKGDGEDGNNRR